MAFSSPVTKAISASIDRSNRKYSLVLELHSDNENDGPGSALRASGVPRIYDSYVWGTEFDTRAFVTNKTAQRDFNSAKLWQVTVEYSTLDREQKKKQVHPLDRPAEISSNFQIVSGVAEKDVNGVAITNTAGQPFDPPIEIDDARKILVVTKNFPSQSGSVGLTYQNAINSDNFLGGAPGTVKLQNISETRVIEEFGDEGDEVEIEYWKRTYEFEYKADGWAKKPLNQGRYKPNGDDWESIKEEDDETPLADPVPLDSSGNPIPKSSLPEAAVFLEFDVYASLPFTALGLNI